MPARRTRLAPLVMPDGMRIRAAQYVRMSTDHQRYSTENQADAIRVYAAAHNMEIVREFTDAGRSGLSIEGRDALKALIAEVESRNAGFEVVLAYDISRWGRFQDADESAFYEYRCKRAGVRVVYCAEAFDNDGSPLATIVKSVKRAMAGEYSRELSTKVFAGHCRLLELGFHQGGVPGYGLRRLLVGESMSAKGELKAGERKGLTTDRVVLVPGPAEEVEVVRRIFKTYLTTRLRERSIADQLNEDNIPPPGVRPWCAESVRQILKQERYAGDNVYNKRSQKLKSLSTANRPEQWVRSVGTIEAIITQEDSFAARTLMEKRSAGWTESELLDSLRALLARTGSLSGLLIDEQDEMASSSQYRERFGSLRRAYALIGYTPDRLHYQAINEQIRALYPNVISSIVGNLKDQGASVVLKQETGLLRLNGSWSACVVVAQCRSYAKGANRWRVRFDAGLSPDITVVVRMDQMNEKPLDYYLFSSLDLRWLEAPARGFTTDNAVDIDSFRFDSLDVFYELSARVDVREAA